MRRGDSRSSRRPPDPPGLPALVLALGLAAAPHALRLPAWAGLTLLAAGAWRCLVALRGGRLPPKTILLPAALGGAVVVVVTFGRALGREAFLTLLLFLSGLKLLETRGERDRVRIAFLACVLVVCHFLESQSIPSAAYMLAVVVSIFAALVGQADAAGGRPFGQNVRLAATLVAQAMPLAVVLFLLFPRISAPLWGVSSAPLGVTGLSDSLAPGSVGRVALSDAVAFRVDFDGPVPPPGDRYWRGPVLNRTDGMRWWYEGPGGRDRQDPCEGPDGTDGAPSGEPGGAAGEVAYTVTLEPHGERWILALDRPLAPPPGARLTRELLVCAPRRLDRVRRDALRSRPGPVRPLGPFPDGVGAPTVGSRAAALARQWAAGARDPAEIVRRGLEFFRRGGFVYTLTPPLLGSVPLDQFLFETRRGFCEHYAAAFASLLRVAGVPARVVTGYLGGERNPVGGYLIVRQADAHAWVEVAVEGRGWIRIDPTAVVAPGRLGGVIDAAASATAGRVRFVAAPGFLRGGVRRLRQLWDAVDHGWNRWVRDYGPERQALLLSRLGLPEATWRAMTATLGAVLALLLVAIAAQVARRRTPRRDPVPRLYDRFCRRLAHRGLPRRPHEGPRDYAARVCARRADLEPRVAPIVDAYVRLRYGGEPATRERVRALAARVRRFRP